MIDDAPARLAGGEALPAPILRPATGEDLAAIMALETDTFGSEAWSAQAMSRDMSDPHCVYVVAERAVRVHGIQEFGATSGNLTPAYEIVGYAGLLCPIGSGDGDIQTIAVAPQARGRGLGRALMVVLLQRAEERRAERIFLEVRADNHVAQTLYDSLGFEEIAVRPGYYRPEGIDAIVMRRESTLRPLYSTPVGREVL